MSRRGWTWAIPAIGGALLLLGVLLRHGPGGEAPVRRSPGSSTGPGERRIRSAPEAAMRVAPPGRTGPELPAVSPGVLLEETDREARTDAVRDVFRQYRSVVACDDGIAEQKLYPLLLLDRESSLACVREEIAGAATELDRDLTRKAEQALIRRIAESEAR